MVPGEQGSADSQGCRLQKLRELNFSLRMSWQCSMCKHFPENVFAWGYPTHLPTFSFLSISLEVRNSLWWGHWPVTHQVSNNYLRAIGRVLLSSGDESAQSVKVTINTSQEKSRSDMQVRSKLPEGTIQINLSELGY